MMFEVLETSWHKLVKDLLAAKDLDKFIESHKEYIETIKEHVYISSLRHMRRASQTFM